MVDSQVLLDVDEASSLALPGVEPEELVTALVGGAALAFEAGVDGSVATGWLRIALPTPELEDAFVKEAEGARMVGLKGHRSVGGVRASLYNAVEPAWCEALASFMKDFAKRRG